MRIIHIDTEQPYDVLIADGLLSIAGERMRKVIAPCRAAIITDTTVDDLYGRQVEESLRAAGYETLRFAFEPGERSKHIGTLSDILEFLAEHQMTRSDVVVALGGGVPGDVAGFAAAVYARGIRFVQIPTTLLAAVDSSVGGKTAIDLKAGKNLAGSFHQPSLVLIDTNIMQELPEELFRDGAGEIIKYGVLADPELFEWMGAGGWKERLSEIVTRCISIKRYVVCEDEFDRGLRQQLNLGHTFGHAIEACSDFSIPHGCGVALGTAIAAGAADKPEICRRIIGANRACGLPTEIPYSAAALAQAALSDKKRQGGFITLVLPEEIGKCKLEKIPVSALQGAFERGIAMAKEFCE